MVLFIQSRRKKEEPVEEEEAIEPDIEYRPSEPAVDERIYAQEPVPYRQPYPYAPVPETEPYSPGAALSDPGAGNGGSTTASKTAPSRQHR